MSRRAPFGSGGWYLASAALAGIVVLAGAAVLGWAAAQSGRASHDAARQASVLVDTTETLMAHVVDAETAQRGYLLTGREDWLRPYHEATTAIPGMLAELDGQVRGDPELRDGAARLRALIEAKQSDMAASLELRRAVGLDAAREALDDGYGRQVMVVLRAVGTDLGMTARDRADRLRQEEERAERSYWTVGAIAGVLLLGLLVAMLFLLRQRGRLEAATAEEQRRRQELVGEMRRLATHDALTGLPNRRLLEDRIEGALARTQRGGGFVGLLIFDVDGLQYVNNSLGHAAGDVLLTEVASRLTDSLRDADTLARLEGDEFVALLEGMPEPGEAEVVAARMAAQLDADYLIGRRRIAMSVSVGVVVANHDTLYDPRRAAGVAAPGGRAPAVPPPALRVTSSSLLSAADAALYEAKQQGPARHRVYDPQIARRRSDRLALTSELRRLLAGPSAAGGPPPGPPELGPASGRLWVAYQPLVHLASREYIGVEALARWDHPGRGQVSPGTFIPVAEETGLIVDLGARVLALACQQTAVWNRDRLRRGARDWRVSVNCSVRQLVLPGFTDTVSTALSNSRLTPDSLVLEITESVLIDGAEGVIARLGELTELGLSIALDDFGTGYSSLSYLRHLPIDLVKVDRSFVAGLGHSAEDEAVVEAVVTLAQRLGRTVLAEGIETSGQAARAQDLGCQFGQGYLFARPTAAADLEAVPKARG